MPSELKLYGIIGEGVNTKEVVKAKLESLANADEVVIRIDSDGGDVFDGFAIYDAIKAFSGKTRAIVESSAFSIASFIATACDEIEITPNGYFMLHNPMVSVEGADDEQLTGHAELLASLKQNMIKAYASRMGVSEQEVQEIMRREKYFNAEESLANGLADRVTSYTRASTITALENVPHRVYAALRSGGGDNTGKDAGRAMSESTKPVAATVSEIKAAFPKAKSDFIVKCIERSLPMASVAAAAAEEMMEENEALKAQNEELMARVAAMEEEMAKAKAMEEEEQAKAMEDEEEEEQAKAVAKWRPGAQPIARVSNATGKKQSATHRWRAEVQKYLDAGQPRAKAVAAANRHNPGLREQYLAEVNAN